MNARSSAPVTLPELAWLPTRASSSRRGARVREIVVHRWSGGTLPGVESWFENPADDASAHVVYAGERGRYAGQAVQMVPWSRAAWTESHYNAGGISIECADAIWLGDDEAGFRRTARMVAGLLHYNRLPARWIHGAELVQGGGGFCRHADLGALGGGHLSCPTTDLRIWLRFAHFVQAEHARGGFRPVWGRAR